MKAGLPVKISARIDPRAKTSDAFVDHFDLAASLLGGHVGGGAHDAPGE